MSKMNWKKTLIILFVVFVLSIVSVAGMYAYFMDSVKAVNRFTVGGSNIELVEDFEPPAELVPGVSFTKDVKIKNRGPNECYVRAMAEFSNGDMAKYCIVDWNTDDWVYNAENQYYYYTEPLSVGELTPSLFTTVTIEETTPGAAIRDFDIIVYAESYQSENFSNYEEAWANYEKNKPSVELASDAIYDVSVIDSDDGSYTLKADHKFSFTDMRVIVTAIPDELHEVDDVLVEDEDGNSIATVKDGSQYSFTMPSSDVTISCTVHQLYTVTINDDDDGFVRITADKKIADVGDRVTLSMEIVDGYEITSFSVTDEEGNPLETETSEDGLSVSFVMPESNVTVSYTVAEIIVDAPAVDVPAEGEEGTDAGAAGEGSVETGGDTTDSGSDSSEGGTEEDVGGMSGYPPAENSSESSDEGTGEGGGSSTSGSGDSDSGGSGSSESDSGSDSGNSSSSSGDDVSSGGTTESEPENPA